MNLFQKFGVERADLKTLPSGETHVEKLFSTASVTLTDEEYLALAEGNDMIPDGSHLPEAERAAYVEDACKPGKKKMLDRTRIHTFRGSDETKDGYGDIVRVDGWKLDRYLANPVFLDQHQSREMPVGRSLKTWKEYGDPQAPGGKSLMFRIYLPAGVSEETDAMHRLYEAGILNAVSVGFQPVTARSPASDAERAAIGLGPYGIEFLEQELLELSGVTIPANGNAVRVKSLELIDSCKKLGIQIEKDAPDLSALLLSLSEKMDTVQNTLNSLVLAQKTVEPSVETPAVKPDGVSEPVGKSFFDLMAQAAKDLNHPQ